MRKLKGGSSAYRDFLLVFPGEVGGREVATADSDFLCLMRFGLEAPLARDRGGNGSGPGRLVALRT